MNPRLLLKIKDLFAVKQQLLQFSELFEVCNSYDSNEIKAPLNYGRFEIVAGYGCKKRIEGNFEGITSQIDNNNEWTFGYMAYESYLKFNNKELLDIEDAYFYHPQVVCFIEHGSDTLVIENNGITSAFFDELMVHFKKAGALMHKVSDHLPDFIPDTPKSSYLENISKIKNNILEGDFYEINYCQKFAHQGRLNHVVSTFNAINKRSPTPFAAFVKNAAFNILCTSPERFLYRDKDTLISQPIKGTNKRLDESENKAQLESLKNNEKEIAENVMIVDLVRNDLSRICETGSIKVEELCGTYPFSLVNQMISSVKGTLKKQTGLSEILRALFPMGSMTGAPKIEVMKNIALYEDTNRGLYSGCLGYFMPNGDFDLNVVIRTMVEDKVNTCVSYHVGGAITYDSVPENEYEECLLKAKGLISF